MRINVNLATRPFVELRPLFLRLRIFMAALVVLGLAALLVTHVLQKKLDVAAAQLNAVHSKVVAAQNEKRGNERRMREPANAAVLTRAHFLNALFLRKSFSWTAVMMDLETVLPSGVQVTSIEPEPTSSGDVMIQLRVSGDRDRAVQLVRNLERSKRFRAPRLTGEATQAKDQGTRNNVPGGMGGPPPGVEFEILANYNPLPPGESYTTAKVEKKVKGERVEPKGMVGSRRRRGRQVKPSPDSFTKRATLPRGGAR
ncbi:MAG: PilN domain-containing protein [Acidobacteriaceae bacterium]